ncbi:hypothetical protein L208DRAFT_1511127 [Tricholoma matsutake]|nr:hypothetical protein L208DRAFT_1511127 [Tricholoma matsutake 945]
MQEGYLDDVFDVLDAHCHPCILMGHFALIWMGVEVFSEQPLDLLICSKQVGVVAADLLHTGCWAEVALVYTYREDYLQPPPHIFDEEAVHLLIDPPLDEPINNNCPFSIQVLGCEALNPVLLELDMHPSPKFATLKPRLLTDLDTHFLPDVQCQSMSHRPQTKVYIPSILWYLDALLTQIRCALFVLGDANSKKEAVAINEKRVKEQVGEDFGSI